MTVLSVPRLRTVHRAQPPSDLITSEWVRAPGTRFICTLTLFESWSQVVAIEKLRSSFPLKKSVKGAQHLSTQVSVRFPVPRRARPEGKNVFPAKEFYSQRKRQILVCFTPLSNRLFTSLICTGTHRKPVTFRTDHGSRNRRFAPLLRAGDVRTVLGRARLGREHKSFM